MSWNYRILVYPDHGDYYFRLHEVYYDKDGSPTKYSERAANIGGGSLEEMKGVMTNMAEAFSKPLINGNKFPTEFILCVHDKNVDECKECQIAISNMPI